MGRERVNCLIFGLFLSFIIVIRPFIQVKLQIIQIINNSNNLDFQSQHRNFKSRVNKSQILFIIMEDRQKQFKKHLSINTVLSVPLVALNFYQGLFFIIYFALEVALLIYKNNKYPLPVYSLNIEGAIIALFVVVQVSRHYLLYKGILNKQPSIILFYIILSIFAIVNYVFYLKLQTYILLVEVVINWVGLGFSTIGILLSVWVWKVLHRKKMIS